MRKRPTSPGTRLFVALQYLLPQHPLSRIVRFLTRVRVRWLKNALIGGFLRLYDVAMHEAADCAFDAGVPPGGLVPRDRGRPLI